MTTAAKTRTQATQQAQCNDSNAQAATPKPKRDPHRVQLAILGALKDKPVCVRLLDGTVLAGTLRAADMFTLAVQEPGAEKTTLLFKHAIASVRVVEAVAR